MIFHVTHIVVTPICVKTNLVQSLIATKNEEKPYTLQTFHYK